MQEWLIRDYFNRNSSNGLGEIPATNVKYGRNTSWFDEATSPLVPVSGSTWKVEANNNYASITLPNSKYVCTYPGYNYNSSELGSAPEAELLMKVVMPTSSQTVMMVGAWIGTNYHNGYQLSYQSWDNIVKIRHWTLLNRPGQSVLELVSIPFTPVRGVYYWIRAQLQGGQVRVKFWEANSSPEPSAWTATNPTAPGRDKVMYMGMMGYNGQAAGQVMRVAQFQSRALTGYGNSNLDVYVHDNFDNYAFNTLGSSTSGHEWVGNHTMSPIYYQGNRSSGLQVTDITRGYSGQFGFIRRGVAVNQTDRSCIGPAYSSGHVMIRFRFVSAVGRIGVFVRGSQNVTNGAFGGTGGIVMVGPYSYIQTWTQTQKNYTHGLGTLATNVEYTLIVQVRPNNRWYAKLFRGTEEPVEWINLGTLDGMNSTGHFGIETENNVAYNQYYLNWFQASHVSWQPTVIGSSINRQLKFNALPFSARRKRTGSYKNNKFTFTATINPVRVRKSELNKQIKVTTTARAQARRNVVGSAYIGGVLTKIKYVNNVGSVFTNKAVPRRQRRASVGKRIKFISAPSAGYRARHSKFVRTSNYTMDFMPLVTPLAKVDSTADFTLSAYAVTGKETQVTKIIKFLPTVVPVVVKRDSFAKLAKFKLTAQVPGKILDTVNAGIANTLTVKPITKYTAYFDTSVDFNTVFKGYVTGLQYDALSAKAAFRANIQGAGQFISSAQAGVGFKSSFRPVKRFDNGVTGTSTFEIRLDRPEFETAYADVIDDRAALIHYAVSKMTKAKVTIQYKHRRTMDTSSRTYFVVLGEDDLPVLFGYSTNYWDEGIVVVYITDDHQDPIIPKVYDEFNMPVRSISG